MPAPKTRLDYPKLEEGSDRSMSAFGSVPIFRRFFLPPALQQFWRGETTTVHPGLFPLNEILFARPSAPLLHMPLLNDFTFPTLLLVDDSHPWSPTCKIHRTIIARVTPKAGQTRRELRVWNVVGLGRYTSAVVWLVACFRFFIWRRSWREAAAFDTRLLWGSTKGSFLRGMQTRRSIPFAINTGSLLFIGHLCLLVILLISFVTINCGIRREALIISILRLAHWSIVLRGDEDIVVRWRYLWGRMFVLLGEAGSSKSIKDSLASKFME